MQVGTAWAIRADRVFGFDKRYVHFATTAITGDGDDRSPEEAEAAARPFRST